MPKQTSPELLQYLATYFSGLYAVDADAGTTAASASDVMTMAASLTA
jgi:hypothetical protein